MKENGFFPAPNFLPSQETDNLIIGSLMLQKSVRAPNAEPDPLMQQCNSPPPNDGRARENFVLTTKKYHIFCRLEKKTDRLVRRNK